MANNKKINGEPNTSRRDFLKVATTAAAGALVSGVAGAEPVEARTAAGEKSAGGIPTPKADTKKLRGGSIPKGPVIAKGRVIGANDRIVVAFVGVGGMGGAHVGHFTKEAAERNIEIGGICDVFKPRMNWHSGKVKEAGVAAASFVADTDYRKILENKDIDAVIIATPEHWHAQVACQAMDAGKHVYIQKPMTRYIDEAFQIHDTAKRTGKVVQVGSQGCSNMIYHVAGKAAREGKIGKLVLGQGSYTRNNPQGEWNYGIPADCNPENLDWKKWLGSAPDVEWKETPGPAGGGQEPMRRDPAALFARYRKYWDYSAGILGDLMPHKLQPFLIASGNPEYPTKVSCLGTRHMEDRDVDDSIQVVAEFPSGWTMLFLGSTVNEQGIQDMFRGEKGTIYFGNGVELRPERPFAEEIEAATLPVEGPTYESHQNHEKNWLEAIRANDPMKANCNVDLATKAQVIVSLAEMSARWDKVMLFDAEKREVKAG
ncbi:MAG: Gfo/Idh/MocA family oxidoreductase [Armatimonadaceae bacterium]